jgi:hypothetical protein
MLILAITELPTVKPAGLTGRNTARFGRSLSLSHSLCPLCARPRPWFQACFLSLGLLVVDVMTQ